ncbi:hypothetical protein [Rikenella microfusus]|uniref:hypothetical protein n=1 Tax=Rikenella microfusus TaxID=28139 RepID=UPI001DE1897E|nr:hypothetical protein [Rikenella microfusus]HJE87623.1 hypothetical protein [Rikenella microfusus]
MRSTEKNKRKQKSSTLPLGIGSSWTTWLLLGVVTWGMLHFVLPAPPFWGENATYKFFFSIV